jgi:hypothetical protein
VHRNKFLYNKTNQLHQLPKFTPAWNSTCFGQFLCPSSGVYSLYTRHWYISYGFVDSFRAEPGRSCSKSVFKPVRHIPVSSVQWINSWWWAEELSETCRVSCRSKFGKLVQLVGFIIKKLKWNFTRHARWQQGALSCLHPGPSQMVAPLSTVFTLCVAFTIYCTRNPEFYYCC